MMSFRMCSRTFTTTPRLPSYHSNTLSFYNEDFYYVSSIKSSYVMPCGYAQLCYVIIGGLVLGCEIMLA